MIDTEEEKTEMNRKSSGSPPSKKKLQFQRANIGNLLASRRLDERDVRIQAFAVANRTMIAATMEGTLRRTQFSSTRVEEFALPRIGTTKTILESADMVPATKVHRVFVDPTGSHVVLSTVSGSIYYLHADSIALKPISGLHGDIRVESLSWDRGMLTPQCTGPVLLGTNQGSLYMFEIKSNGELLPISLLFRLDITSPIDSINFERFPDNPKRLYVMCATTAPHRFYEFVGNASNVRNLFENYNKKDRLENFVELPSNINRTELHFFGRLIGQSESFAMLTDIGIYHGNLSFGTRERVVCDETFMYFHDDEDMEEDIPISIAMTEFHFLLLYQNEVVIRSRLSPQTIISKQRLVQDEFLYRLVMDPSTHEIYAYSSSKVFRLHIKDEARDVWRLYLQKANQDPRYFENALQHCRTVKEREFVANAQAEYHLRAESFVLAARYFARTSLPL